MKWKLIEMHVYVQMVGRKRKISYEDVIHDVLSRRDELFDKENNLHPPSHACWASIAENFQHYEVSPKDIWTLVKCQRLGDIFNNNYEKQSNSSSSSSSSEEGNNNNFLNLSITLSWDEWSKLAVRDAVLYRDSNRTSLTKTYTILRPGSWASVINERITESSNVRLRCCIAFKRCKIYPEGAVYLKIEGKCTICKSSLKGKRFSH